MSSVARGGQRVARAAHVAAATAAAPRTVKRVPAVARRTMGGHARHIGLPGEHVPIHVGELHKNLGTVYLTTMFLWMMYRAKNDGLVLLVSYETSVGVRWCGCASRAAFSGGGFDKGCCSLLFDMSARDERCSLTSSAGILS